MEIVEIEIGPHFLTFYGNDKRGIVELAPKAYQAFCKAYPELAPIQQENFIHVRNDPLIYHPYGEPDQWKEHYRHIHIRYNRRPVTEDILNAVKVLTKLVVFSSKLHISHLEDNNPDNLPYPKLDYSSDETYLESIEKIKRGEQVQWAE